MRRPAAAGVCLACVLVLFLPVVIHAGTQDEFDNAKWKLQLNGWVSAPTGYFRQNGQGYFDLQRDFGSGSYVTFAGKMDWRFKRKPHLFFATTPVVSSRTTTVTRTISWQGQTYDAGAQVNAKIQSLFFTPGYEYDFFRLRQISLGFLVDLNLAYTQAEGYRICLRHERIGNRNGVVFRISVCPSSRNWPYLSLVPIPDSPSFLSGRYAGRDDIFRLRQFRLGERCPWFPYYPALGCPRRLFVGQPIEGQQLEQRHCDPTNAKGPDFWCRVSLGNALRDREGRFRKDEVRREYTARCHAR